MPATASRVDVVMPRLSDAMEEGILVAWLVADGDQVSLGQEICEVETDKATMPYECEAAGAIHLLAREGEVVPVGRRIAVIGDAPENEPEPPASTVPSNNGGNGRINASPVARRLAADLGIELATLAGSGPRGRVVKADVLRARESAPVLAPAKASPPVSQAAPATEETTLVEPSRLQQVIARRMSESKAAAPDFTLQVDVDMEATVALRSTLKELNVEGGRLPSYNDFVIKACAIALREHPLANAAYKDGAFELHERINVGFAVAAENALVVPTIFDADTRSLGQIASESRRLAERVRDGSVTPPELGGGTFSISNLGMFGIDAFVAVLNPPQAAILAVGALKERPVIHDGTLCGRHTMTITLTCDHRILYGAPAAEFLARIKQLLEGPAALVL
jgi:pyruvate dehydrogenase E2 component (dihydrolipoamide acetyltransferase)